MALNISGIFFFMPVFSFLFVAIVVYALLTKTKVLGGSKWINLLTSFIVAVVFMSFSSAELYVRTVLPWFVVLMVVVFLILLIAMFSTKAWDIVKQRFSETTLEAFILYGRGIKTSEIAKKLAVKENSIIAYKNRVEKAMKAEMLKLEDYLG